MNKNKHPFKSNPWDSLQEAIIHAWFEKMEYSDEYRESLISGTANLDTNDSRSMCKSLGMERSDFWKTLYNNHHLWKNLD